MKVYYNSACPVCKAGIERQRARSYDDGDYCWYDVHLENERVDEIGAELEFVRERLHVVDEYGRLRVGFDAFLAIWRESPGESWKAVLFGWPPLRAVCRGAYNRFAALLYKWNRSHRRW